MTLTTTPAAELASALQKGETTSVECTTAFLDRIEATNPTINAFLSVDRDGALAKAEAVDTARGARQTTWPARRATGCGERRPVHNRPENNMCIANAQDVQAPV